MPLELFRIAAELGLAADVPWWREKIAQMQRNLRPWFFSVPDRVHQYHFAGRQVNYTRERPNDRPIMILTALCLPGLDGDLAARLERLFSEIHQPAGANAGFAYTKYPDNNLCAYGLIDRSHAEARAFIEAILRDSIRAGEFAEVIEISPRGEPVAGGVKPSLLPP